MFFNSVFNCTSLSISEASIKEHLLDTFIFCFHIFATSTIDEYISTDFFLLIMFELFTTKKLQSQGSIYTEALVTMFVFYLVVYHTVTFGSADNK